MCNFIIFIFAFIDQLIIKFIQFASNIIPNLVKNLLLTELIQH